MDAGWRRLALGRQQVGATRLGFALLLKFFEIEARFPRHAEEVPSQAVDYVAEQVGVDAKEFGRYSWRSRSIEYHRAQIRTAFGFREFSRGDEDKLAGWLAEEICPVELREDRLRQAALVRCRAEGIEPPGRLDRLIGSARSTFEQRFCLRTVERLSGASVAALEVLVAEDDSAGRGLLAELKADPGQVGLETVLAEIDKLTAVRQLGLPDGLFADASEKLVAAWRARAMRTYPSDLRDSPREVRLTLLAALCWMRQSEITDALVDLLIGLAHKINTKADRKVERELTDDLRRVRGKEGILFRMAGTALEQPDEQVRTALYPVVGDKTLQELVKEAEATEQAFRSRVRTVPHQGRPQLDGWPCCRTSETSPSTGRWHRRSISVLPDNACSTSQSGSTARSSPRCPLLLSTSSPEMSLPGPSTSPAAPRGGPSRTRPDQRPDVIDNRDVHGAPGSMAL